MKRTGKGPAPPKELFALGAKVKAESETKASLGLKKPVGSTSIPTTSSTVGASLKREREGSGSSVIPAAKRSRVGGGIQPVGRPIESSEVKSLPVVCLYEDVAIEVDGTKLVESVLNSVNDLDRIDGLICGAVKNLKLHKLKPDEATYIGLMFLSKSRPELFQSEIVVEAFCSMLKKDTQPHLKTKTNSMLPIISCNMLVTALKEKNSWPDSFVKTYLDDSLGDRVWVDLVECRSFVENILTAFNTKLPPNVYQAEQKPDTTGTAMETEETTSNLPEDFVTGPVLERYTYQLSIIEPYVMEVIRDQLSRRQPLDGSSKNLVRTLIFLCGIPEIRTLVVQRLDIWLQSPKLMKAAQDLLMSVCLNFNPRKNPQDLELINNLCRIRFKTKNLTAYFNTCLKELLTQNSDNIPLLLQHVMSCELSNARNQNNLNFINVIIQQSPENGIQLLADVVHDQLMAREDYLKPLRVLLREIMRFSKVDFKFNTFIYSLIQDKSSHARFRDLDPSIKERYISSVIDLVVMTMLLCINNSVREAALNPRAEAREFEALREFQNQISVLQREVVWWLHAVVVKMVQIKPSDYMLCLKKVLFIEKTEVYSRVDNWPPESERGAMLKLVSEVPLQEGMLLCIVLMGHNKELHLSIPELIDLLETVIRRAAMIYTEDSLVMKVDNTDFMGALLNLCAYRHPENSVLPKGYKPPSLAITSFYWKAWQILLIISAFNPTSIGLKAWKNYPTLKCLMEMTMTNNFCFPPVTMATDEASAEEIKLQERQMTEYFKQQTLEFECHLAGNMITETNSRLLPQLCRMEVEGFLLKPPQSVLDSVRLLNQQLSIGKLLCQSREPADFLLSIIQRQGTSQSMLWLKDLVESNDSSLEVLPVQCLCEFLLHDITDDVEQISAGAEKKQKNLKQEQLLARLQDLVRSSSGEQKVLELINQTLSYFLERLSFNQNYSRRQATKCLSMILGRPNHEDVDLSFKMSSNIMDAYQWLFKELPSLSHFEAIKMQIFMCIRAACQVETNITAVSAYIGFLSQHSKNLELKELDDLVLDVAQLILERVSLVSCLLPNECDASKDARVNFVLSSLIDLFYCHLSKARQPRNETYSWSNNQYQILLHWSSGQLAKMNILIVHAMVIILAYGPPEGESHFNDLMDAWFPLDEQCPTAYLIDTSEEALLIPDWLKLRMIRSNVPRLIDASFGDAEIPQLLLFIQSFGISVHSMDKLLDHLDSSVENHKAELLRLVDKNYMAELIEVQHMRGAKGGDEFHKLLTGGQKQLKSMPSAEESFLGHVVTSQFVLKVEADVKSEESNFEVLDMLDKLFLDYEASKSEKSSMLRSLHKIANSSFGLSNLVDSFTQMICTASGTSFIESLFGNPLESCSLFKRILLSCKTKMVEDLCAVVLSRSKNPSNFLAILLNEHVNKSGGALSLKNQPIKEENCDVKEELLTEEKASKRLKSVLDQPLKMEKMLTTTLIPFIKQVNFSSNVLKTLYHLHNATCNSLSFGLVLDSIELFSPKVLQDDLLDELLEILFKNENSSKLELPEISDLKSPTCTDDEERVDDLQEHRDECFQSPSEYLLCLLLHRSGWSNLIQVVDHILPKFSTVVPDKYDHSIVLDFIEACFNLPSLWQGRDKKVSKHQPVEDILSLNLNQIRCLVVMAVKEQERRLNLKLSLDDKKITSRLNLIESCCCGKSSKMNVAMETICGMQESDNHEVVSVLLWGMYLRIPKVFINFTQKLHLTQPSMERLSTDESNVDIATHLVLTCLLDLNLSSARPDEDRLSNATMVSKKLASQHPLIFLRELPLLSSFLQGHAQFLSTETKSRSLNPVFINTLGIVYLLQPYIFHSFHSKAFHSIIDSYAQIIMIYGSSSRYLNGLVKKFLEIIFNYFHYAPDQAYTCLIKHLTLLKKLDKLHEDLRMIQRFLLRLTCIDEQVQRSQRKIGDRVNKSQVIKVSKTSSKELFSFTFSNVKCLPFTSVIKMTPTWEISRTFALNQRTSRLNVQSTSELIDGLKELDEVSRIHVDILEDFMDNIEKLILDGNVDCRENGYALLLRMMRYNPRSGRMFHLSLKKCLASQDCQVVQAALNALKEFTVLSQEHAPDLLVTAFKIGLAWNMDVTPYINGTLQILNLRLISH